MNEENMYVKFTHYHMWKINIKKYLIVKKPKSKYTKKEYNILKLNAKTM